MPNINMTDEVKAAMELLEKIAIRFGITKEDVANPNKECDPKRDACMVYLGYDGDEEQPPLKMHSIGYSDEEMTKPIVFDCKHDALRFVVEYLQDLMPKYLLMKAVGTEVRKILPEHFHLIPAVEQADEEIADVSDAVTVLSKFTAKEDKQ